MFLKRKSLVINVVDQQPSDFEDRPQPGPGEKIVLAQELTKCAVGGLAAYKAISFSLRMAEHFITRTYPVA